MGYSGSEAMDKTHYPRTGRRGVPQQFPRKVYEMLQAESSGVIVHWSTSGRAFRIADVALFSTEVLPKYFKTSKFSSFQRNLNLYGFTKIRKGPEIDMYFHPSFIRGNEGGLTQLRKRSKASRTKHQAFRPLPSFVASSTSYSPDSGHSMRVISPVSSTCNSSDLYDNNDSFKTRTDSQQNQERLALLADAMVMMLGEE